MFKHFNENRFSIVLACRQSGKSISSVAYILWYVCFHSEKTVAILANKGATARELLDTTPINIPRVLKVNTTSSVIRTRASQFTGSAAPNKGTAVTATIAEVINP